jgi:hypothetical protein
MAHKVTGKHHVAIAMLVEDKHTDEQIAEKIGVTRDALARWKTWPEFDAEYQVALAEFYLRVRGRRFAIKERRVAALNEIAEKYLQVIDERAIEHAGEAAGGGTGLIVEQIKLAASGDSVTEYVADVAVTRELRATLEQLEKELGQRVEKVEHSGEVTIDYADSIRRIEQANARGGQEGAE